MTNISWRLSHISSFHRPLSLSLSHNVFCDPMRYHLLYIFILDLYPLWILAALLAPPPPFPIYHRRLFGSVYLFILCMVCWLDSIVVAFNRRSFIVAIFSAFVFQPFWISNVFPFCSKNSARYPFFFSIIIACYDDAWISNSPLSNKKKLYEWNKISKINYSINAKWFIQQYKISMQFICEMRAFTERQYKIAVKYNTCHHLVDHKHSVHISRLPTE